MSVGFFNIFTKRRTRIAHTSAPQLYTAHSGDLPTAGAETFAFQPRLANPVYLIKGPGVITGSLRVVEPRPVIQHLALPSSPYQGVPVGTMALQGLIVPAGVTDASN